MKIRPVGADCGLTDRKTDRQTDMSVSLCPSLFAILLRRLEIGKSKDFPPRSVFFAMYYINVL